MISELFYSKSVETWKRVCEAGKGFRSTRYIPSIGPEYVLGMCCDGIGTKIEVAERMRKFDTLGFDLVAMVADDASALGATPILLTTTIDAGNSRNKTSLEYFTDLAEGLSVAAQTANVPVVGGEFAQMGDKVFGHGELPIIWNAALTWKAKPSYFLANKILTPGLDIVAFSETGVRSNGFTLLTELLEEEFGSNWHLDTADPLSDLSLGLLALQPSKIYTPTIQKILSECNIVGMLHITGGGLSGRLQSYLKQHNVGAELDNLFPPGYILNLLLDLGLVNLKTAYSTWNMGNGFLVFTNMPDAVIKIADENGVSARRAGVVTEPPKILIHYNNCLTLN
jgi:phosphoribosylformylglycinamidine cyclo-ligase